MTNTEKLEMAIANSGLKREYIASKLNASRFTLLKKINNESEFKASEISTLRSLLNLSLDDVEEIFFYSES